MAGSFKDVSHLTGVAVSTLSKVENDQMSLTYDKLLQICAGLGVHVTEMLSGDSKQPSARTRRSATSATTKLRQRTRNVDYHYLATDLVRKRMVPMLAHARARTLAQFGPLTRHAGEEFLIVLRGEIELHTDQYAPVRLKAGESVYIDSTMGHRLPFGRRGRGRNAVRLLGRRVGHGKDPAQHHRPSADMPRSCGASPSSDHVGSRSSARSWQHRSPSARRSGPPRNMLPTIRRPTCR